MNFEIANLTIVAAGTVLLSHEAAKETEMYLSSVRRSHQVASFEREERKRRRREEKEKKVTRAGIEPTAAAPSQPARLDVSRTDHLAGS